MEQEIKDIIAKHLPAQVGDALKLRLLQADTLEADNARLTKEKKQLLEDVNRLSDQVINLDHKLKAHSDLAMREAAVLLRENKIDVYEANLKAAEAEKRATELHGLVQTVFKSPVYRTSYINSIDSDYDAQGRYISRTGRPSEKTETID